MTPHRYPSGWHAVVDGLRAAGQDVLFGLPGDDLAPLRAAADSGLRLITCCDQRNAVFMAIGYARATGRTAACVVGKGPATTNAVTGLLEADAARVPLVLLGAGTDAALRGTGAFQELDHVRLLEPLVKLARRVESPDAVCRSLDAALVVASGGRPGPVYLELPENVGAAPATRTLPWPGWEMQYPEPQASAAAAALRTVCRARRPLVVLGGGTTGRDPRPLTALAERLGAGILVTASGRGAVAEDHPLFCGLAGLYAQGPVRSLWQDCDLLVALGTRLEETAVFGWSDRPSPPTVVQVNLHEGDLSCGVAGPRLLGDGIAAAAGWVGALDDGALPGTDPGWTARVRDARERAHAVAADRLTAARADPRLHVIEVLEALRCVLPADPVLVQENGLQDMWSYHHPHWSCTAPGGAVTPSEQTPLGFGAAAAIGVRLARPERPVVGWVGDGAFALAAPELATAVRERLGVLWVVLDNGGYGWLEHQRAGAGPAGDRFAFTRPGPRCPVPEAGVPGVWRAAVTGRAGLEPALDAAWEACCAGTPAVVRVPVHLTDVPPGLAEIDGEFPVTAPVHGPAAAAIGQAAP